MMQLIICPVCERGVSLILKWRGIYVCTPCRDKYEKIELILKEGQVLEGPRLEAVLKCFGEDEIEDIKKSDTVNVSKKKKRQKKDKNSGANIAAPKRRKKHL